VRVFVYARALAGTTAAGESRVYRKSKTQPPPVVCVRKQHARAIRNDRRRRRRCEARRSCAAVLLKTRKHGHRVRFRRPFIDSSRDAYTHSARTWTAVLRREMGGDLRTR